MVPSAFKSKVITFFKCTKNPQQQEANKNDLLPRRYGCHSTHAFCTNRIGLDPVYVCSSTWRPCFVKHRINVQVHTNSWCQKWDLFEQASSRSTRNSSSENKGTFHVSSSKNSKFNTRSSRSLSVQVSNFKLLHIQTRVLSHLK